MNRILEIDGDETVDLMNFNGGGLVQGLNGGGLVDEHKRLRMLRNRIKPGPDGQWSKEDKKKRDQLSSQIQKIHDQIIAQNASQKSTPTTQTPVNDKKSKRGKSGIGRLIGGTADQLTGNLFDFDKRSGGGLIRKTAGALARPVGGLADQLTGNLFDFDKKSGGGLIRKTAGAVGGLFGGGKKEGGTKGSSGILGPISSNVDAMVNTDKYEVKPKEKKNVVVAYEQEASKNQQQQEPPPAGGNDIPAFDVRPPFMTDQDKLMVLGMRV